MTTLPLPDTEVRVASGGGRQDGEQMGYGTDRRHPGDPGDDWYERQARQPASRRARNGRPGQGRGPAGRPGGRSGRRGPGRGYQQYRSAPSGRWQLWRRFRSKSRLAQFGYTVATVGAVITVVAGVGGYVEYERLVGNVHSVSVGDLTGRTIYGAQNILVLGSQERQGQKGFNYGFEADPWTTNSDNLLLVHLDPTHTHAIVLSIPRDTMTYEPGCKARIRQIGIGIQGPYQSTIIDGALNIGGPTCAVETVSDLTGIKFDHFVEFDFNSFRDIVDAIGGVNVCVPKGGYHDPKSHVNLHAGMNHVEGLEALALVRTRDTLQDGSDTGGDLPRIEVQQAFLEDVMVKVTHMHLLDPGNALTLLHVAGIATKALTVDKGLGTSGSLISMAKSLIGLHTSDVTMLTMPNIKDPQDPDRLLPEEPEADVVFGMTERGQLYRGHLPLEKPGRIKVRVLNGTGIPNLASHTADALRKLGFEVSGVGDAGPTAATTVSYYGIDSADEAYTLMASLKSFAQSEQPQAQNLLVEPTPQAGHYGTITLTLGTDYANFPVDAPVVRHPVTASKGTKAKRKHANPSANLAADSSPSTGPGAVQSRNGAENVCDGLPLG
jgi:LCP family protein required for cell wall assembly